MKTLRDIQVFRGVKVLVRIDFNVPIKNNQVVEDFRIRSAFPTIDFLTEKGAKVILIGHLESNEPRDNTFKPVVEHININLGKKVSFIQNINNAGSYIENEMKDGDCVLIENLRYDDGEKKNDQKFASALASLADIYVNDAFSVCHREHASVVGVPVLLPSYAGFQLENEIIHLNKAFKPEHPFIFILCGAKFETKLPLLEKFIDVADYVYVGGALATDFFKEKGYEVGKSFVSEGDFGLSKYLGNKKIILPIDLVNQDNIVVKPETFAKDDSSMDCGPETIKLLKEKIDSAKMVLWNGPLGVYEKGYKKGTLDLAKIIADNKGKIVSVVGGGDTVAAISENNDNDKFSFISTGGGAMLEYLAKGSLPGIKALEVYKA